MWDVHDVNALFEGFSLGIHPIFNNGPFDVGESGEDLEEWITDGFIISV
jgi:hypothetical protein